MKTGDWALIVSLFSLAVAMAGFVWSVWSKFIFPKPVLQVSCAMLAIHDGTGGIFDRYKNRRAVLTVVNHGPIKATVLGIYLWDRNLLRRFVRVGMLNPMPDPFDTEAQGTGVFAGGLPKTLEVGEVFHCFFPPHWEEFLEGNSQYFGVSDTFRKLHSASRNDIRTLRERIRDFIQDNPEIERPYPTNNTPVNS